MNSLVGWNNTFKPGLHTHIHKSLQSKAGRDPIKSSTLAGAFRPITTAQRTGSHSSRTQSNVHRLSVQHARCRHGMAWEHYCIPHGNQHSHLSCDFLLDCIPFAHENHSRVSRPFLRVLVIIITPSAVEEGSGFKTSSGVPHTVTKIAICDCWMFVGDCWIA